MLPLKRRRVLNVLQPVRLNQVFRQGRCHEGIVHTQHHIGFGVHPSIRSRLTIPRPSAAAKQVTLTMSLKGCLQLGTCAPSATKES